MGLCSDQTLTHTYWLGLISDGIGPLGPSWDYKIASGTVRRVHQGGKGKSCLLSLILSHAIAVEIIILFLPYNIEKLPPGFIFFPRTTSPGGKGSNSPYLLTPFIFELIPPSKSGGPNRIIPFVGMPCGARLRDNRWTVIRISLFIFEQIVRISDSREVAQIVQFWTACGSLHLT